ncbi:hypothetical protein BgAZ_403850 [Babesia gibsoni]|uniref:Uncharacterized protein n=1 Tax=Babesia gibsoni TaxID=33632 RepID=A0AAD8LGS9_BABGI|nr:hypothetical protein BgAZ_403850 [Babesia gibsoni]
MPYCLVTPCLERGSIAVKTHIDVITAGSRAVYSRERNILSIYGSSGSRSHVLSPAVHLTRESTEIPHEAGHYLVTLTLEHVLQEDFGTAEVTSEDNASIEKNIRVYESLSHGSNAIANIDILSNVSATGESELNTRFAGDFDQIVSFVLSDGGPSRQGTRLFSTEPFVVGFPGLNITQHSVESISLDDSNVTLTWRIGIRIKALRQIDLKLAALGNSSVGECISKCNTLVLRCRRCDQIVEQINNAVVVPLPSEFYTTTIGSTFCEECEPHLTLSSPTLAESHSLVYEGEEVVTLYKPDRVNESGRTVGCESCSTPLGTFSDCSHKFVSYRKCCVAGLRDDTTRDIYWRHSPEIQSIESLQYAKGIKILVAADGLSGLLSHPQKYLPCIEIIKVTSSPDTLVIAKGTVFEASRILWRWATCTDKAVPENLPEEHVKHLIRIIKYFSQEPDPVAGYTPSLLVAV